MENSNGRQPMFTTMQFGSVDDAQNEVKKAGRKEIFSRIGLILGIVATASFFSAAAVSSVNGTLCNILVVVWIISMIGGYAMGGILYALVAAWKIAKFGWYIVPFPYDIIVFVMTFTFAAFIFMCIPVVFTLLSYIQVRKDKKAAEDYLASFGVQAA